MSEPNKYRDSVNHLKWQYRIGKERRLNWTKHVLEEGTPMPRPISYKDIDEEFVKFVEKGLEISYNGKEVPTISLFSNQRISEIVQSWQYKDDNDNFLLNLKTVSRENNPQWGGMYDKSYNIPGKRSYSVYYIPTLGENGQVTYDRWSVRQPKQITFVYTINIITNKLELLNDFNLMVNERFSALQCYIFPLGYAMSMVLDSISDSSENSIDNRKYYQQTYKIKLRAYIIEEDDFIVTKMPTRWKPSVDVMGTRLKKKNKEQNVEIDYSDKCEEYIDDHRYEFRNVSISMDTGLCNKPIEFCYENSNNPDSKVIINNIESNNIERLTMFINEEIVDFDNDEVVLTIGDKVKIEYGRKDILLDGTIVLSGYDALDVIDIEKDGDTEDINLDL